MCDNGYKYALSARTMEKLDARRNPLCGCFVTVRAGVFRRSFGVRPAFVNVRFGVQNSRLNSFERQNQHIRDKSKGKGRPV